MKKNSKKGLVVFWISLAALVCAAVNLNDSLNELADKEQE